MNTDYLIIFDYAAGTLRIIELGEQEQAEYQSGRYPAFHDYVSTIAPRYSFSPATSRYTIVSASDLEIIVYMNGIQLLRGITEEHQNRYVAPAMTPRYLIASDESIPALFVIQYTPGDISRSEHYDNYEDYLDTLADTYGLTAACSQWMITETLTIRAYQQGREVPLRNIDERLESIQTAQQ